MWSNLRPNNELNLHAKISIIQFYCKLKLKNSFVTVFNFPVSMIFSRRCFISSNIFGDAIEVNEQI